MHSIRALNQNNRYIYMSYYRHTYNSMHRIYRQGSYGLKLTAKTFHPDVVSTELLCLQVQFELVMPERWKGAEESRFTDHGGKWAKDPQIQSS